MSIISNDGKNAMSKMRLPFWHKWQALKSPEQTVYNQQWQAFKDFAEQQQLLLDNNAGLHAVVCWDAPLSFSALYATRSAGQYSVLEPSMACLMLATLNRLMTLLRDYDVHNLDNLATTEAVSDVIFDLLCQQLKSMAIYVKPQPEYCLRFRDKVANNFALLRLLSIVCDYSFDEPCCLLADNCLQQFIRIDWQPLAEH